MKATFILSAMHKYEVCGWVEYYTDKHALLNRIPEGIEYFIAYIILDWKLRRTRYSEVSAFPYLAGTKQETSLWLD